MIVHLAHKMRENRIKGIYNIYSMKRWIEILICALLTICGLNGCVKEDLSDCPTCSFALYGIADSATDLLSFNQGEIFLFDSDGVYIETLEISNSSFNTLAQGELIHLYTELESGDYTAIFWGHSSTSSDDGASYVMTPSVLVAGVTTIDDITINGVSLEDAGDVLTRTDSDATTTGPARDIWAAELTFTHVNASQSERVTHNVTVRQQTKTIDVTATFILPDDAVSTRGLADGNTVEIKCYDETLNMVGASVTEPTYYSYIPFSEESIDENTTLSHYRKMSLHRESTKPILVVKAANKVIYEEYLFTILEGTSYTSQYYLDKEDHYNIDLNVVVDNVAITIWVNGWRYVPVNGGVKQ